MAHYEMYVCLKKATYESAIPSILQPKLGWKVEDTNKPTNSNTVAEIKAWLDAASISYSGVTLKADLLVLVDTSGPTVAYTPTWKEAAFAGKLGAPRASHDSAYTIVKGEFSMKEGELSAIANLGNSLAYPNNSVLTKTEAQTLVVSSTFTGE